MRWEKIHGRNEWLAESQAGSYTIKWNKDKSVFQASLNGKPTNFFSFDLAALQHIVEQKIHAPCKAEDTRFIGGAVVGRASGSPSLRPSLTFGTRTVTRSRRIVGWLRRPFQIVERRYQFKVRSGRTTSPSTTPTSTRRMPRSALGYTRALTMRPITPG
jgi:hypothetical protein